MKTANQILESWKKLKGIKEDSQECECSGKPDCKCDDEIPAVQTEPSPSEESEEDEEGEEGEDKVANPELEKEEPVELQEDEEVDSLEDAKIFQVVMDKINIKPVQAKADLLSSLVNDLASLISGLPSGELKLRKLMTEFKKKSF